MRMKLVPAAIATAHILLGNLCFMPMASAMESMFTDPQMEMDVMQEMVMTPASAMSPLHCDKGCVTITRPSHVASGMGTNGMPCNDGHCLSEQTPSLATATQSPLKESQGFAILPATFSYKDSSKSDVHRQRSERPPIRIALTRTVVLRE